MQSDLYPDFDVVEPMKINKFKNEQEYNQMCESGEWLGSRKIDGALYQLVKNKNGKVGVFSRTISKKTGFFVDKTENVPHIKEWVENNVPVGSAIISEIYYPHKTSKDVTSVMGCKPDKAIARQENNPIFAYLHDVTQWDGEFVTSQPYIKRIEYLDYLQTFGDKKNYITFAQNFDTNLDQHLQDIFNDDGEGMVFRRKDGIYVPGKRPTWCKKMKQEDTFDSVIIGFVQPERVYTGKEIESWPYWEDGVPVTKPYKKGWVAGISIGAYDKNNLIVPIGTISSGMTDFWREDMARNPQNYIGKIAEIQCMSVDKEALSVRHGRLVNVRDDKNETDCTIDTIFK